MPDEEILIASDDDVSFINVFVRLADGRRLPVLDGAGNVLDVRSEILALRGATEDAAFVDRLKRGLSNHAGA